MLARCLQFLGIGALLFALERGFGRGETAPAGEPEAVEIAGAALRTRFSLREGRPPTGAELDAMIRSAADEEILLRAALALGLERRDPVVRQHLVRNMRFVSPDSGDDEALFEEALSLGMERSDPVARRRLVFAIEQILRRSGRGEEPSDAELERFLAESSARFRTEPRVRFTHVFLSREKRGDRLEDDAASLLLTLREGKITTGEGIRRGDRWLLEHSLPLSSLGQIGKTFGGSFAESVAAFPSGRWSGPLASAHGLHLVLVHETRPGEVPPLAQVRARVRYALLRERMDRAFRQALEQLREAHVIRVLESEEAAS